MGRATIPTDEQYQIGSAIQQAVEAVKDSEATLPIAERDFNALLAQAKTAFPDVPGVQNVSPIEGGTNIGELRLKLSLLYGPILTYLQTMSARAAPRISGPTRSSYLNRW